MAEENISNLIRKIDKIIESWPDSKANTHLSESQRLEMSSDNWIGWRVIKYDAYMYAFNETQVWEYPINAFAMVADAACNGELGWSRGPYRTNGRFGLYASPEDWMLHSDGVEASEAERLAALHSLPKEANPAAFE